MTDTLLPGAQLCAPFRQGDLDGLCGLYAAINALQVVLAPHARMTGAQGRRLLAAGLVFLGRETQLQATCVFGMTAETLLRLIRHLAALAAKGRPYAIEVTLGEPARWSRQDILRTIDTALERAAAVILLLGHTYEHYSVVVGASDTRYLLFDSYKWHWITRDSLGTHRSSRRHRLAPSDIIIVTCLPR